MRSARVTGENGGYYHCMSRVVEKRKAFGPMEKEVFRRILRKVEGFSGVRVLTYSVMDNHFHILVYVPPHESITDSELIRRLRLLYPKAQVDEQERLLEEALANQDLTYAHALRDKYLYRMYDISQFMKTLKQRFTVWFNRQHHRRGTLWEERFKSILIEGREHALLTVAAYIDLNSVRGGLSQDPKDYRYCGYAEAVAGSQAAQTGLCSILQLDAPQPSAWKDMSHAYRQILYLHGEQKDQKTGFSYEMVQAELNREGKLPVAQILRCKVRYFSDGVVLGSKEYVERIFQQHRNKFGVLRKTGARQMHWSDWNGLCTMRDLRRQVVCIPLLQNTG